MSVCDGVCWKARDRVAQSWKNRETAHFPGAAERFEATVAE